MIDGNSSDRTAEVLAGFGPRVRFGVASGGKSSTINRGGDRHR